MKKSYSSCDGGLSCPLLGPPSGRAVKRGHFFAAAFLLAAALSSCSGTAAAQEIEGVVVEVASGDALTLVGDHQRVRVRLAEIAAPVEGQPYAKESRNSLVDLCYGKAATLTRTGTDVYGWTLGRVSCGGISANDEQVRRGMAWVYQRYEQFDAPLRALEAQAKAAKRGLWQGADPVPPWVWARDHPGGSATPSP